MRTVFAVAFGALFSLSAATAKQPHCILRFHAEGNEHDSDVFSSAMQSRYTGKKIVIEKTPSLSEHDIVAFRPYPTANGTFGVLLLLDDHGKIALDTLSIEHRGRSLFVFINGRPLTELQVDRRVADGKVYLPSGLTTADIALMQKDWPLIGAKKK